MSDKTRYQRTFATLHSSRDYAQEVREMTEKESGRASIGLGITRRAATIGLAACLLGGGGVAYAADLGGIRTQVEIWIHGEQVSTELVDQGGGSFTYETPDGEVAGGGVAIEDDGSERPLTSEEFAQEMAFSADVEQTDDGHTILWWYDQSADVTDDLADDGAAKVHLVHDGQDGYFSLRANDDGSVGYSFGPDGYPDDDSWSIG